MTPLPAGSLDLRGILCPMNFVRTRLALEELPAGAWLSVTLDPGEPAASVARSARLERHTVLEESASTSAVTLRIRKS